MSNKRKPLSKKIRFEVFKRDKFTCQYCGRMSPDVILEVDHIKPVAEGGENDILNLITSCRDCNRGKGKRKLDDHSEAKKQQERIKELAEKNEQLMMLMEWREELSKFKQNEVDIICEAFENAIGGGRNVNDHGRQKVQKLLAQFSVNEILDAIDIAVDRYYVGSDSSVETAFNKIGGICYYKRKDKVGDKSAYYFNYLRKSCASRFSYVNEHQLRLLVMDYIKNDDDFEIAKSALKECSCWTDYRNEVMERFE